MATKAASSHQPCAMCFPKQDYDALCVPGKGARANPIRIGESTVSPKCVRLRRTRKTDCDGICASAVLRKCDSAKMFCDSKAHCAVQCAMAEHAKKLANMALDDRKMLLIVAGHEMLALAALNRSGEFALRRLYPRTFIYYMYSVGLIDRRKWCRLPTTSPSFGKQLNWARHSLERATIRVCSVGTFCMLFNGCLLSLIYACTICGGL